MVHELNPTHVRAFVAVAHHLNFTRAAEQLYLSQPAVSRQIKQLEETLGVRLFEQLGKRVQLTDAGRAFVDEGERLLGAIERAAESMQVYQRAGTGRLRIGASTTPGYYLLPGVLRSFRERFPHVELRFVVENSLQIERLLVRNELDLGFVGGHLANEELSVEPVVDDEIVCFASPTHPLATRRRIDPAEDLFREQTWVMRERGSATRRLFESWLKERGTSIDQSIEVGCAEAIKLFVDAGIGVSFMSLLGLGDDLRRKRFARLAVAGLQLHRSIYLVRHRDKQDSPAMNGFLEVVQATGLRRRR